MGSSEISQTVFFNLQFTEAKARYLEVSSACSASAVFIYKILKNKLIKIRMIDWLFEGEKLFTHLFDDILAQGWISFRYKSSMID